MTLSQKWFGIGSRAAPGEIRSRSASGTKRSGDRPTSVPKNARGVTPATVNGSPFTLTARPGIAGSPSNRVCQ